MKVLIAEDEAISARKLIKLLKQRDLEVVAHVMSNEELIQHLNSAEKVDLYFLDIHLNDGIIFDVLTEHQLKAPIIFTTAYDQYAIRAFKQNSIDYLLKPINEEELDNAINQFKSIHQSSPIDLNTLQTLLSQSQSQKKEYRERIKIKIGDRIKVVSLDTVSHIYSESKITFINQMDQRSYPIDYTLDKLIEELNPRKFYRINRSCIVNIDAIEDVISYSNSRLKLKLTAFDKEDIIVARERVKNFKNWLG